MMLLASGLVRAMPARGPQRSRNRENIATSRAREGLMQAQATEAVAKRKDRDIGGKAGAFATAPCLTSDDAPAGAW